MNSKPTMSDVARVAGVSAMTVSRAFARHASISSNTSRRVLQAAEALGYVFDVTAGELSTGRSNLVAVVIPSLKDPLLASFISDVDELLRPAGLQLIVGCTHYSPEREESVVQSLVRRNPVAIIVGGVRHTEKVRESLRRTSAAVIEVFQEEGAASRHALAFDNLCYGRTLVRRLQETCRKTIIVAASRETAGGWANARIDGLVTAACEAKLQDPIVLRSPYDEDSAATGAWAVDEALGRSLSFDAVVCMSDLSAICAIDALRDHRLEAPSQVSVFGFGDSEIARFTSPSITSFSVDGASLGAEVGGALLSVLSGRAETRAPGVSLTVAPILVARASG
jgi:LacI family gluconate utilization system Gnt-I transcriptional repressor